MTHHERSFVRRLDLVSLQLFIAVCETGSIGRAAEREYIAASAISKRITDLEEMLGAALFYRHSKGVSLTPAGESLLHHARSVLLSLEKMQGELSEYATGVRGHVRVYANLSAIVQFLPEDLGSFLQQHQQIKIDLQEHLSAAIVKAVEEGATDIGICADQGELHGLQSRHYRDDQLAVIVPHGHRLARYQQVTFQETLDDDQVGLPSDSAVVESLRRAAALAGKPLKLGIQVTSLDAVCRMIQNGLGIGVMPMQAFEFLKGVGALTAIPLSDDWARRRIVLLAREFDALPMTARLLVEHLTGK
jgi:DNA-binding transcriptional LysR family regulator